MALCSDGDDGRTPAQIARDDALNLLLASRQRLESALRVLNECLRIDREVFREQVQEERLWSYLGRMAQKRLAARTRGFMEW